jgi:hypothetical protein
MAEIRSASKFQLLLEKAVKIVVPRKLNGRAERSKRLHKDFALEVAATGPACYLGQ